MSRPTTLPLHASATAPPPNPTSTGTLDSRLPPPAGDRGNTLADLTAVVRRTTGGRPPPLVGCSVTVIGDAIYVFGGRLVSSRRMVSSLYSLDLTTFLWSQLWPPPSPSLSSSSPSSSTEAEKTGPAARYFHSAEAWGNKLILFGGEGYSTPSTGGPFPTDPSEAPPLRTLDDVWLWDTTTAQWEEVETGVEDGVERPEARYAHLGVVNTCFAEDDENGGGEIFYTGAEVKESVMIILGGQDISNTYLHSVNVLNLNTMKWVRVGKWEKHIGTYRAVVATSQYSLVPRSSSSSISEERTNSGHSTAHSISGSLATSGTGANSRDSSRSGVSNIRSGSEVESPVAMPEEAEESKEELISMSYSKRPRKDQPEPIFIFSNFNFTQVRRDLDLLTAPVSPDYDLDATTLSSHMSGSLPPGLRFPTGAIIGHHLIIFGTYLSTSLNNFSIWSLDLGSKGGKGVVESLRKGERLEWCRVDPGSVLMRGSWNRAVEWRGSVVVLGDRERDIGIDYNHRQINFAHVAIVDLEAFGIYQPPTQPLPPFAQSLGLSLLNQPSIHDFEIVCSDGIRLGCSRKILEERWGWFKENKIELNSKSGKSAGLETSPSTIPLRSLSLPEPSPLVFSFLQYLYTRTLCTPLQLALPNLTSLLIFSKTYDEKDLRALVVHALHESLREGSLTAAVVYNVAGLGGCMALQIRALRLMMSRPLTSKGELQRAIPAITIPSAPDYISRKQIIQDREPLSPPPAPGVLSSRPRLDRLISQVKKSASEERLKELEAIAFRPTDIIVHPSPTPTMQSLWSEDNRSEFGATTAVSRARHSILNAFELAIPPKLDSNSAATGLGLWGMQASNYLEALSHASLPPSTSLISESKLQADGSKQVELSTVKSGTSNDARQNGPSTRWTGALTPVAERKSEESITRLSTIDLLSKVDSSEKVRDLGDGQKENTIPRRPPPRLKLMTDPTSKWVLATGKEELCSPSQLHNRLPSISHKPGITRRVSTISSSASTYSVASQNQLKPGDIENLLKRSESVASYPLSFSLESSTYGLTKARISSTSFGSVSGASLSSEAIQPDDPRTFATSSSGSEKRGISPSTTTSRRDTSSDQLYYLQPTPPVSPTTPTASNFEETSRIIPDSAISSTFASSTWTSTNSESGLLRSNSSSTLTRSDDFSHGQSQLNGVPRQKTSIFGRSRASSKKALQELAIDGRASPEAKGRVWEEGLGLRMNNKAVSWSMVRKEMNQLKERQRELESGKKL